MANGDTLIKRKALPVASVEGGHVNKIDTVCPMANVLVFRVLFDHV
jgi:hypothetical protein